MAFDLSILNEEERDRVLNIASEISMAAMSLDFNRIKIYLDSFQEIFEIHQRKIEDKLLKEEDNNFQQLIEKNENGQFVLTVPHHRGTVYWPIFRKNILKSTDKAFGIPDLEATKEMREESLKQWKSEPIHWIPKSKIISFQGLYFAPTRYCQSTYILKFQKNYVIKFFEI